MCDLANWAVSQPWQDRTQIVANRDVQSAATFNDRADRRHSRAGLRTSDVDPVLSLMERFPIGYTSEASKQCSNNRLGNLSASLAVQGDFGPNSERSGIDADVEFLSVEGEGPSFFRRIGEPEKPPVNHKGMVVYPRPLDGVDHADPGGTSRKLIVCPLFS